VEEIDKGPHSEAIEAKKRPETHGLVLLIELLFSNSLEDYGKKRGNGVFQKSRRVAVMWGASFLKLSQISKRGRARDKTWSEKRGRRSCQIMKAEQDNKNEKGLKVQKEGL